jgi:3-phosphoshikimate 1-carboxyvinyltransferase
MSTRAGYPSTLTVAPITRAQGSVRLPGSKSISNRVLLLAALAHGTTELSGLLDADDTRVMIDALRALGIAVEELGDVVRVTGCDGAIPNKRADLFLGNAGTAMRPLAAMLAWAGGHYMLDGVARMRERPIGDLVDALNALGAQVRYGDAPGYPPLHVAPARAITADSVQIRGDTSSQFVSSLLMAAPLIAPPHGLVIDVPGALISQPYVTMTVRLMARFGVQVQQDGQRFRVPRAGYASAGRLAVEGDASGASYFLALGAIAGGPVRVNGVGRGSVQGDVAFTALLQAMGAEVEVGDDWIACGSRPLHAVDYDCTAIPDAAMTAAVVAGFAHGRTCLRGIGSWRVKETDRIAAIATELRKLGATVEEGADWLAVHGPVRWQPAAIDTYDDHRIAMCFSLAAAGGVPVTINDPGCVAKTFPDYFTRFAALLQPPQAWAGPA